MCGGRVILLLAIGVLARASVQRSFFFLFGANQSQRREREAEAEVHKAMSVHIEKYDMHYWTQSTMQIEARL